MRPRFLILFVLTLASAAAVFPVRAQTERYRFEPVVREGAILRGYVSALGQDSLGYIWIGTASGLVRDDGTVLERPTAEGVGTEFVYFVDGTMADGDVVVGTQRGLARIDRDEMGLVPFLSLPDSVAAWNDASTVMREGDTWWVGTFGGGLYRFDPGADEPVRIHQADEDPNTFESWVVNDLARTRDGDLWIATSGGLDRMDADGRVERYGLLGDRTVPGAVLCLFEDESEDGLLWLAERTGLSTLDTGSGTYTPILSYSESDLGRTPGRPWWTLPQSMAHDPIDPDVLWVISEAEVIRYRRSDGETELLHIRDDVSGLVHHPESIFVDRSGLIWIGTLEGLVTLDVSRTNRPSIQGGALSPEITGEHVAAYDPAGRPWIVPSHRPGPLRRLDPGFTQIERSVDFARSLQIRPEVGETSLERVLIGPDSWAWMSFWMNFVGAYRAARVDLDTGEARWIEPLEGDGFRWVFFEGAGPLLVITNSGELVSLDPERGTVNPVQVEPDPRGETGSSSILDATRTADGAVWAATENEIVRVASDGSILQRVTLARHPGTQLFGTPHDPNAVYGRGGDAIRRISLTDGSVTDVYSGSIGTAKRSGGILWFEDGDFTAFDLATHRVLRRYASRPFRRLLGIPGGDLLVLHHSTGLELNMLSAAPTAVFSTPVPVIKGFNVLGDATGTQLPGRRELAEGAAITLPSRARGFSVSYLGITHREPRSVRYSYRLDGYQPDWIDAGTMRRASFPSLPPGTYTFEVRASEAGGPWSSAPARVEVTVLPPWWRTAWAYALYVLLGVGAVLAWETWRRRQIRESERRRASIREAGIRAEAAERDAVRAREHVERMRELDEAKNRFFTNISHEFRTPLTILLGPLREWLRSRDTGILDNAGEAMHRNAVRLLALVNQVLDLSKLEAGELVLNPRPVDLESLLTSVVDDFKPLAERRDIALSVDTDPEMASGLFDPDAVEKVVSNLVSNALKFTDRGGKVNVSLRLTEGEVCIAVRDTGTGIPEDRLDSVFERFRQVDDSTTRSAEGTGIGLSLVSELVDLMGGTLDVESQVGFGSTFTVRLPFEPAEPSAPAELEEVEAEATTRVPIAELATAMVPASSDDGTDERGRGPLVLVVDDNPDIRDYVARHLASDHRVLQAADGESALRLARRELPELVIADVMMPGMDGFALCAAIREDEVLRSIPLILLTASADEESRIRGLEEGADDYLTKPFSVRELEVRVTNLILSRRALREAFARTIRVIPEAVDVKSRDDAFVETVLGLMNRHLGDSTFGTDMLASEVGLSRRQVERRVLDALGRTPPDLLREMRLERATQILTARPGTVAEVAEAVGFRSASHFSTVFRKTYGVPPTEYVGNAT